MATSHEAYVDTSALIAFMDGSDSHHAIFVRLFSDPPRLCTSPLVIAEGHGWFLRRFADQTLTLTDAVGLHLARARKCKTCWSTDRHLRLAGTPLVIDGI